MVKRITVYPNTGPGIITISIFHLLSNTKADATIVLHNRQVLDDLVAEVLNVCPVELDQNNRLKELMLGMSSACAWDSFDKGLNIQIRYLKDRYCSSISMDTGKHY